MQFKGLLHTDLIQLMRFFLKEKAAKMQKLLPGEQCVRHH
jgi:hypothetical protein